MSFFSYSIKIQQCAGKHSNTTHRPQAREVGKPKVLLHQPKITSSVVNQGAKSRQLLRFCTQLQNLKITLATFLVLREKWTSVSQKLTNIPAGIYQGKQGSVTLSKERKLIRPLSTWQNLRGMPSNLFSTVSSSSLEGGLSLHIKQTKSCDGRKSTYQSI
jgi:hypothetical protein